MKFIQKLSLIALTTLAFTSAAPAQEFSGLPVWWRDVHVCTDAKKPTSPLVIIGVVGEVGTTARYELRSDRTGNLPGYLEGKSGLLDKPEMEVWPSDTVGYTDEYFETFRMPNGVLLSCTPL